MREKIRGKVKRHVTLLMYCLFIVIFSGVGIIGFMHDGENFVDAAFSTLMLYALNYDDVPPNLWVGIARWLCPVISISGFIVAMIKLHLKWSAWILHLSGKCVAVYSDEDTFDAVSAAKGYFTLRGREDLIRANRYVLAMDERENLEFYKRNRWKMRNSLVYLKCHSIRSQETVAPNVKLFSFEELGARLYWKKKNVFQMYQQSGEKFVITLIGFGKLGEELLIRGLQNNIFSPDQKVEYHIFADPGNFFKVYHETENCKPDRIIFHSEPWYSSLNALETSDLLIVCELKDQLELVNDILFAANGVNVEVFADDADELELIQKNHPRLIVYDWRKDVLSSDVLFEESTLTRAKWVNLHYAHLFQGVEETLAKCEEEWKKLDSYNRYSNISAADYQETRRQMLDCWNISSAEQITPEQMELLAELEHMRWNRFHYLNNWTYGEPVNGKAKCVEKRTHADLRPYKELPEDEKEKDRENIRILLRIP